MKSNAVSDATIAVRRFRERQRERGLVKKDVWIRPEHAAMLSQIEHDLRTPQGVSQSSHPAWTLEGIYKALSASPMAKSSLLTVTLIEGAEPSLRLGVNIPGTDKDPYIDVLLAVGGDQVLVETLLWPASAVNDVQSFNESVLRTHKFIPLASFSIIDVAGHPYYTIYGALDARSSLSSLLFEIQAVADASQCALALYSEHLTDEYLEANNG